MTALVRPTSSMLWEIRGAWASGRRVALSLTPRCVPGRIEGHVTAVSPTGAHVHVAGLHIPADEVLAVHHPSRLGDSDHVEGKCWHGRGRLPEHDPRQLVLEPTS